MYVVVGNRGLDNQCIAMWMANVMCVSLTESDVFCHTSCLLGRPLVRRANRPFPSLSKVMVLGSLCLHGQVQSTEDGFDFARRSCLALVLLGLGAPIADIILDVSLSDELLSRL